MKTVYKKADIKVNLKDNVNYLEECRLKKSGKQTYFNLK